MNTNRPSGMSSPNTGAATAGSSSGAASTQPTLPPSEKLAVIYVHGMGDQTRLYDPTTILNNLESYWQRFDPTFHLNSDIDQYSSASGQVQCYLRSRLPNGSDLDFHEVYWAPEAPEVGATDILRWLRKQLLVPYLRRHAPWAELSNLKRGVLGQAVSTRHISHKEAERLRTSYLKFVKKEPHGTFFDFARVTPTLPSPAVDRWHKLTRSNDWTALCVVMSMILATLVFALFVTEAALGLVRFLQQESLTKWAGRYGLAYGNSVDNWYIMPLIVMSVIVTPAWLFGVRPFFGKYMGDVVQWATYQETSAGYKVRRAILTTSIEVFEHVLDSTYDRVIVIAHSLGSVIAHDSMLFIKQRSPNKLDKVSHFVTYGSPIDKFAYFFEGIQGLSPRYVKTVHQIRGDLFDNRVRPLIWQNFYEEGDPISGTIHTTGPKWLIKKSPPLHKMHKIHTNTWTTTKSPLRFRVQNIYTANANVALISPNHTGYTNKKMVLFRIWNALLPGCFPDTITNRTERTDVDVMAHTRWMRQMYSVILLIPWVLLSSFVAHAAYLIQAQSAIGPEVQIVENLWMFIWLGFGISLLLLAISFLWPIHLLKPVAVALTVLMLIGVYAAYTTPTCWRGVPVQGVTQELLNQQSCHAPFSGIPENMDGKSSVATPLANQYTPSSLSWSTNLWSIVLGFGIPAILTAILLLVTRFKSKSETLKVETQTHERPNKLLPIFVGLIIAFVAISTAGLPDGQAILPWWWWRTTFLYATFSLIIVALVQFIWPGPKLRHMLKS